MSEIAFEYLPILVFMALAIGLSVGLVSVSLLRAKRRAYDEKLSPYECGFDAFDPPRDNARIRFDVRFYLVTILFIIFDLEIAFLFPWALSLSSIGWFGFGSVILFLIILTVGFIYEWKKGALEWE